ncbi:MAG: DsrE family protein [Nitrospirae bacterium]|nr:DsrE family protein [Nitrospirota bacterium]
MQKVLYVITHDPKDRCDLVSGVFAQALTALSLEFKTEVFLMDRGIKVVKKDYIKGMKSSSFDPLADLIRDFREMGGKLYVCHPFVEGGIVKRKECEDFVDEFINSSRLLDDSEEARVFTY